MSDSNDHDLLIEIRTIVKNHEANYIQHLENNAKEHETFEKGITAAHKRIDWILGGVLIGVASIIISIFIK